MKKILILIPVVFLCLSVRVEAQTYSWQKLYNTSTGFNDQGNGICKADSTDFYIVGTISVITPPFRRMYLLKINKYGDTLWTRTIIAYQNAITYGGAIATDGNGNCVITGIADSAFAIKVNSLGNIVWRKTYFSSGMSWFKIIQSEDKGYLLLGRNTAPEYNILKIDSSGELKWRKIYTDFQSLGNIFPAYGNGYIITGYNTSSTGDSSFISRLNSDGDMIWIKRFRIKNSIFSGSSIVKINNGYSVSGISSISGLTLCKFDSLGNISNNFSYPADSLELNADLKFYNNKYLLLSNVVVNNVNKYSKLRILDSTGTIQSTKYFKLPQGNKMSQMELAVNGDVLFLGQGGNNDFSVGEKIYCARTDSTFSPPPFVGINYLSHTFLTSFTLHQNYPNPFNPSTKISYSLKKSSAIELKLLDINGRMIKIIESGFKPAGSYEINFSAEGLASGVYFFSLYSEGILMDTKKAVVMK